MADFAYAHGAKYATYGINTANSQGTTVTTGAANTKGSWAELTASSEFASCGIMVHIGNNARSSRYLVDIGVGASGSEDAIIPNLLLRAESSTSICTSFYFPLSIASGTRIAARAQSEDATVTLSVSVTIVGGGFMNPSPFSRVLTYGADTTNTDGKFYQTSGTSNNTKSGYQQLTASTTLPIKALMVGSINFIGGVDTFGLMDIAVGGAGSETVLIPNLPFNGDTTNASIVVNYGLFPCSIPSGTRLSYREQVSQNNVANYVVVILYALC